MWYFRQRTTQEAAARSRTRLETCINYCRAAEAENIQLKEISSHGAKAVHHLNDSKIGRALRECKYCSRKHERGMEKCPAYGKTCPMWYFRQRTTQEAAARSRTRLETCINYCRAAEAENIQLKEISSHGAKAVHHLNDSKIGRALRECKYCSRKHERGMEKCPAYGKTCTKCSNQNHFSYVCLQTVTTPRKVQPQKDMQRSKPKVHAVHKDLQPSSEDELWVLSFAEQVNAISSNKGRIY